MTLTPELEHQIAKFLQEQNMIDLYRTYEWEGDTYKNEFSELFQLEKEISSAAKNYSLNLSHLKKIAVWGRHQNPQNISSPNHLNITLYSNDEPVPWLSKEPVNAICIIDGRVRGFGPTFSSKLLHFAVPQIFGALDTRLVRIFGKESEDSKHYKFLNLKVLRPKRGRPSISPKQDGWPEEYGTWIAILNHMAELLNQHEISCPHPEQYIQTGLREKNKWLPADVETALFSYASQVIEGKR